MNSKSHPLDNFLALDTAGGSIYSAVYKSGEVFCKSANREESRSRNIAVLTKELLQENEMSCDDLRCVIVALGPGSFTGLRVGLAFAKGIIAAREVPLIGVTRFEQITRQLSGSMQLNFDGALAPDEVMYILMHKKSYYRRYVSTDGAEQLDVVVIEKPQDLVIEAQAQGANNSSAYFIDCAKPKFKDDLPDGLSVIEVVSKIESLFGVAEEKVGKKEFASWTDLEPLYVQRSSAEVRAQVAKTRK